MKYSIIIPVYNVEKTLDKCLQSVQNQTFKDFEVIMINDGSSDLSGEICARFAKSDRRFKYIEQSNQGVSAARNKGIRKAQGEYIAFLDSDDEYTEFYLEAFEKLMEQVPDCNNYWCGFKVYKEIDPNNGIIQVFSREEEISISSRKDIMTLHERWMDSTLWNKVFRRSIIIENQILMDIKISLGEDLLFNYNYLSVSGEQIAIINRPNYCYYQYNNNSLDSKYRRDLLELYERIDAEILNWLVCWDVSEKEMRKYYSSIFYMQEKIMHNTFRKENSMGILKKYSFNSKVMGSAKFRKSLEKSDCFIHPLYKMAYKSRLYFLVQILDFFVNKKRRSL